MATELGELGDFLDPGLALKINGKRYVVPLPSGEVGLWCQLTAQAAGAIKAADTPAELAAAIARVNALPESKDNLTMAERLLGPLHAEMLADEVPHHYIEFVGATAYIWIIGGEDAALKYYQAGGRRPEAGSPANRAARRAATKAATGVSRTAGAARTPSRASTRGTKSRTTSGRASKAAPKKAR